MSYILYSIYFVLIVGLVYLIWAISNVNRKMKKIEWLNAQEYTILRIDVPRNNDKSPLSAEQMFASIHGIYSESAEFQNHLSFEIVSRDKFVQFYLYLPIHLKDFVEGQIYAQYPTVEINEVDDYVTDVDTSSKHFAICELNLNKPEVYPIKLFNDFEVDPISGITSVMSKLNEGEEVWMQTVVRPVGDEWQEKGHSMVSAVRSGKKFSKTKLANAFAKSIFGFMKAVLVQAVAPGEEAKSVTAEVKLPASVEEALKSIETKITKLGFESKIRIVCISNDAVTAKLKCQNVAAAFKQYNTTNLNGFKAGRLVVDDQSTWKDYAYRSFEDSGEIFNIAELASIYHFPHSSVSTPNIVWSGSKKGEPPANLPIRENVPAGEFSVLGETTFRNQHCLFGIKTDDRRRHIYIVGKSGVGKSVLIENMAINDINAGRGVIIVDPHGDLVDKVSRCIPEERTNDVIVFDPSDRDFPIAFNVLEAVDDDFKTLVASGFVGIFKKMFGESWGPRLEHILRNTVLALLDYPDSTMLDIPRMLTNNRFRDKVVEKVKDTVIREFWVDEFAQYDQKFRTEAVSPILNKVGQFLSTATIRNIVGQPKSRLNIREAMDQAKIILVNLSRGKIGEDNSALLGAMLITKIQLAAMSRADVSMDKRIDCFLYVDEFQNFATESFATILSEARKYNLSLTIAHQYIAQMDEPVKDAVFGNAGTLISFRVGGADADVLVKEFAPVFEANDMVNLDKYNIYIKLLVDGISAPAFSARTLAPVAKMTGTFDNVLNVSHQSYSRPRAVVEEQIQDKGREEEIELKKEAELFKSGGLEALLLKKKADNPSLAAQSEVETVQLIQPDDKIVDSKQVLEAEEARVAPEPKRDGPAIVSNTDTADTLSQSVGEIVNQAEPESEVKPRVIEPRQIKWQNILDGKIYKERTARGNVKWFIGEDIDEEKLATAGVIVDDQARDFIALSKKVATGLMNKAHPDSHHPQGGQDSGRAGESQRKTDENKPIDRPDLPSHLVNPEISENRSADKNGDNDDIIKNASEQGTVSSEKIIESDERHNQTPPTALVIDSEAASLVKAPEDGNLPAVPASVPAVTTGGNSVVTPTNQAGNKAGATDLEEGKAVKIGE